LDYLPVKCIGAFARHCAQMQVFEGTLQESVDAAVLGAITDHWPQLATLFLLHDASALHWSDALESALKRLIMQRSTLKTVAITVKPKREQACARGGMYVMPTKRLPTARGTSQLWCLWVEHLSTDSLATIASHCPQLFEVMHKEAVPDGYTKALAAHGVRSVGFPGISVNGQDLQAFTNLVGLRLWNIGRNQEESIRDLCARSPSLKSLELHFAVRPDLTVIPEALAAVPRLRWFALYAVHPGGKSDFDVTMMVRATARKLCPEVELGHVEV
jgi:hypothetical protein